MAKILECVIVELLVVVRDEYPGDPEVANDAFLDKALDIFFMIVWFCFDLFGKVVDPHDEKLELPYGNREGSYYV